jgi:hypothetical protein
MSMSSRPAEADGASFIPTCVCLRPSQHTLSRHITNSANRVGTGGTTARLLLCWGIDMCSPHFDFQAILLRQKTLRACRTTLHGA